LILVDVFLGGDTMALKLEELEGYVQMDDDVSGK